MMPTAINTQIPLATQATFVDTPMPNAQATRVLPDAVPPTVNDVRITPDHKGNGGYTPAQQANAPTPTSVAPPILSMLIPASFSTSNATLSASAMFATHLLSQEGHGGGSAILAEYENLMAAAQVKYMPSNATLPTPAPDNLFAKMAAEIQNQKSSASIQTAAPVAKEAANAPQAATNPAPKPVAPAAAKPKPAASSALPTQARHAASTYQAVILHNAEFLEAVEAVKEIGSEG